MHKIAATTLAGWIASGCFSGALADPLRESESALRSQNIPGAIRILETASAQGNVAATGQLASYLRNLPPPYQDPERACSLARKASDASDPMGAVTRAECLMAGTEKSDRPFESARDLARSALKSGFPTAGFTLFLAYSLDPRYSYPEGGGDRAQYNALAALPVSSRGEQIEAFDGLAEAVRAGHMGSLQLALGHLADSSAPRNNDRFVNLADLLVRTGQGVPTQLAARVGLARKIKGLGTTNIAVKAFADAHQSALLAARLQLRARGLADKGCDAESMKLVRLEAEPVQDALYLPITKQPFVDTYLMRGHWGETWTFAACQETLPVRMAFSADGWSGVRFQTTQGPAGAQLPP
jgi:TPR repeat protein